MVLGLITNPLVILGLIKIVRMSMDAMGMASITTMEEAEVEMEKAAAVYDQGVEDWDAAAQPEE